VLGLEGGEGLDNELVTSRFVPVAEESEEREQAMWVMI
jgi:hypothetical protein